MIEVLNKFKIASACLGNHDFDFGLDVLVDHVSKSNFPWLLRYLRKMVLIFRL